MSSLNLRKIALNVFLMFSLVVITSPAVLAASQEMLDGAKKEGKLALYFSLPVEEGKILLSAFEKKYPFIETEFYRAGAYKLDEKFKAEARAGRTDADVMYVGTVLLEEYKRTGLIVSYKSPEYASMRKIDVDPDGYWAAWKYCAMGIIVNSKILPKHLWPMDWIDFINARPEWKGNLLTTDLTVASSAYMWLYGMKMKYGFETAQKIMEGIKKADGQVMLAYADGMTKVSTGEKSIITNMMLEHYFLHKKKGAPIQWIIPKSGLVVYTVVGGLVSRAPHPNAGKLFIDFVCSKEGQDILAQTLSYPSRPDVILPSTVPELVPLDMTNVIRVDELAAEKELPKMREMWLKAVGR